MELPPTKRTGVQRNSLLAKMESAFEHLYDRGMSQAVIEQDWDLVASLAADLHDAHGRLVDAVAVALVEGSWQAAGIRSPEHWLVVRAGLSRGHAAAVVLMARRASELPATASALREGRISLDQAAVVARHAPAVFDTTAAEFAQHATVPQLQRSVARYDFTYEPRLFDDAGRLLPAEAPAEQAATGTPERVEPASLSMGTDADGRFRLRYEAPAEVGELVRAALAEAKDHLFHTVTDTVHNDDGDDHQPLPVDDDPATVPGPRRVTWADALVLLATRSLDAAGTEQSAARRARYRVQVHLDTDGGWLTGTPRLPRRVIEGLTCDGILTPVWETDGHPVNVGRSHRVVPHRTRVLVLDRDRGCRFPRLPHPGGRLPRGAPPDPLVRRGPDRPGEPGLPLQLPPRRARPRRVHHHRRPHATRRSGVHHPPRLAHRPAHSTGPGSTDGGRLTSARPHRPGAPAPLRILVDTVAGGRPCRCKGVADAIHGSSRTTPAGNPPQTSARSRLSGTDGRHTAPEPRRPHPAWFCSAARLSPWTVRATSADPART